MDSTHSTLFIDGRQDKDEVVIPGICCWTFISISFSCNVFKSGFRGIMKSLNLFSKLNDRISVKSYSQKNNA